MAFSVKALQRDFFSNKDTQDFFLSDDSDDAYNFKYISKSQFKHIIKDVRRQRTKKKEEKDWASLTQDHLDSEGSDYSEEDLDYPPVSNVKKLLQENMEEVDRELKRLKQDSLPERKKSTSMVGCSVDAMIAKESPVESPKGGSLTQRKDACGESMKMLLTIPEEINTSSVCGRSRAASKHESSTKKSHSQRTLRLKSESLSQLNYPTNDSEYNYSSGLSERYGGDSYQEDSYDVLRPHPVVAHKIFAIQKKISELLDEIAFRLNRIPLPDGDRDARRRQQRVMEFSIRFSRNYLYDLGRQIADINRHVRAIMPSATIKPTRRIVSLHMQGIEQKLTSAHQLLLHALTAYCKHIPSSVITGQPDKLKEILQVVIDLKNICTKVNLTTDYFGCGDVEPPPLGNDTEKRCSALLLKLRVCSDNESQIVNNTAISPVGGLPNKKRASRIGVNLPTRLSMYSGDSRLLRSAGSKKFAQLHSRERKAPGIIPRSSSPHHHPSTPEQCKPSPVVVKSPKGIGKRRKTKISLPPREDEISTMMSTLATDSDAASTVTVPGYSQRLESGRTIIKGPNVSKCSPAKSPITHTNGLNIPIIPNHVGKDHRRSTTEASNQIPNQQLSTLVPVIADLMTLVSNQYVSNPRMAVQNDVSIGPVPSDSMAALMTLLKKYRSSTCQDVSCNEKPNVDAPAGAYLSTKHERSRKRSNETRSDAKNMQFICMTSAGEEHDSVARQDCFENSNHPLDASTMYRATKRRDITNLIVSETSQKALFKYRDELQSFSRSNPMYTSNSQNKPWEVVAWIANKLLDDLIVDVSKEFQMEDTIRQLFALEFREF